jgi:hypothetical protein
MRVAVVLPMPMRLPPLAVAALLCAVADCQTRQFEADQHRAPAAFLGGNFLAFAVGDVDGDGDLDALATSAGSWLVPMQTSLFRKQAGSWHQTGLLGVPTTGGIVPRVDPALVDLDGDGDLDAMLIVSNETATATARIVLFRNTGGVFAQAANLQLTGVATASVAVADVDGDSDRDLVVATTNAAGSAQPLALWVHDGAFGFQAVANAMPTSPASAPVLFDVDGDVDADVAAVDAAGSVLVFTNQNAVFSGGPVAAANASRVTGGDLDGDGDGDLVVQQPNGSLVLLRNTASGFQPLALAAGGIAAGQRPVIADVDGDLDLDIAHNPDDELRLPRNDGLAGFTEQAVASATSIAAGDADQDGVGDLLFGLPGIGIAVALGQPGRLVVDPALLRRPFVAAANRGFTEEASDLDGDGHVDILQQDYWRIYVRKNHGAGAWSTVPLAVPFLRPRARAADVDGDGDQDIVAVNGDTAGGLQVFLNTRSSLFVALPLQTLPAARIAGKGDFNGDSRTDLLVGTGTGSTIQLLRSTGGGVFAPPTTVFTGTLDWFEPGIWDFDGDGDLDLLTKLQYDPCCQLLSNDGNGNFTMSHSCLVSLPPQFSGLGYLRLADIDRDGDADLFTWGYGSGQWLVNNGSSWAPGQVLPGVFGSSLLQPRIADWDDDGDVDLLQLGGPAQLWLNAGNGTFVDATATRIGWSEFSGSGAADLDGDGDLDVVGVFGMLATQRMNHLRSATSLALPQVGGQMQVRYAHEPGYATGNAICIPILSLRSRPGGPLAVPGIGGALQIDLTVAVLLPFLLLPAPSGTALSTFAIPIQPGLLGFDLHGQGLVLTTTAAFTPAVHERVL